MNTDNSIRRTVCVVGLILAVLLTTARSVSAKGNFDKVTIQDIGSGREIAVTDPALMGFFAFSDFDNGTRETPKVTGPGYEVMRWAISREDGITYVPVDRLRWYDTSSTNTLGRGWIFYEGLINGSSEYDGKWFTSTRNGDALMENTLFSVQATSTSTASTEKAGPTSIVLGFVGIGAATLIGAVAAAWFLQQRKVTPVSKQSV